MGNPGRAPLATFLMLASVGAVISYLGTTALVLCLWLIGLNRPVTKFISAITGTTLAAIGYLPFIWLNWSSSGPDSGPPIETFVAYSLRDWNDPFLGVFLAGGLITALLYDTLARKPEPTKSHPPSSRQPDQP